jgi:hypothetical protein
MTKALLLATVTLIGFVSQSNATVIATFAQNASTNTVVATDNSVTTTIVVDDAVTGVNSFGGGGAFNAYYSMTATSNDPAVQVGGAVIQHYDGNFCFSSAINCGGTNYLSGVFSDAAFGALGGPGLVVNANSPPDFLSLTSDIIPASDLQPPSSFSLAFTNVTPVLSIDGATINGFTAAFAGTVSATTAAVPEPASLGILGLGLLGLGMIRSRKQS